MKLEPGLYLFPPKYCSSGTEIFNPAVSAGAYQSLVDNSSGNGGN